MFDALTASLSYSKDEPVNGVNCKKYTGNVNAFLTKSNLEFWIDTSMGLAFKYINKTKTGLLRRNSRRKYQIIL